MKRDHLHFLLLNIGHFLDHLFTLVFATVAALALTRQWDLGYADLLRYATPGFVAFGVFALPAGWLADRWSRDGMMAVFFVGVGVASIATGFSRTPLQIAIGLFAIGTFAAIYHPVGLAIVTAKWKNTGMRIAVNGVWGNLGVASAALITGYLIDNGGWRSAFILPGILSVLLGFAYLALRWQTVLHPGSEPDTAGHSAAARQTPDITTLLYRVSLIVFVTTAVSGIIFQSTTFALPKIFDERLQGLASDLSGWLQAVDLPGRTGVATLIGTFAFTTFAVASLAQLVVGALLDRHGPRTVFMAVAALQFICFLVMPGLRDAPALAVALGFMLGAFGQIPINDFMIGKMASGQRRAQIYGVRYVVSFSVLAASLPMIAFVYEHWGFDALFRILASAALIILAAVLALPRRLPVAARARPGV